MIKFTTKIFPIIILFYSALLAQEKFEIKMKLNGNNYEAKRILNITVLKNGQKFYTVTKKLLPHYSIPQTIVFDNGNLALLHSLEGVIEFYDSTGLLKKTEPLITKLYNEHSILSGKGFNKIALLISENKQNKIIVFDSVGNAEKTLQLESGIASGIVFSNDNKALAASLFNWKDEKLKPESIFIDIKNNTKRNFPVLFNNGMFSKNKKSFAGFTNKNIFKINLFSDNISFNKEVPQNEIISDILFENNNLYFIKSTLQKLENGKWKYKSAKVVKVNEAGKTNTVKEILKPFTKIGFKKSNNTLNKKTADGNFTLNIEE